MRRARSFLIASHGLPLRGRRAAFAAFLLSLVPILLLAGCGHGGGSTGGGY
jgi:hypothetical protein